METKRIAIENIDGELIHLGSTNCVTKEDVVQECIDKDISFRNAWLVGIDFRGIDFKGKKVSFVGANMSFAKLKGVDVKMLDISGAKVWGVLIDPWQKDDLLKALKVVCK